VTIRQVRFALIVIVVVAALVFVGEALAHSLPHRSPRTIEERIHFLEHALAHHRFVVRHGAGYPKHWHSFAYGWTSRELQESERVVHEAVPAIRYVFGHYAGQAMAVARCESGSYWPDQAPHAVNGQYLGMFQMGSFARGTYGHGATALDQARAAYRYFVASGRDWSPWACKPW
jgi:hypothetical protein